VATRRYSVNAAAFNYAANVTKTLVAVDAAANRDPAVTRIGASADGVTGAALALLVELCHCTFATAGTATAFTPVQSRGKVVASAHAGFHSYTAEPTVMTAIWATYLTPNQPTFVEQFSIDDLPEANLGEGLALRVTNPTSGTAVNVRGFLMFEER
jgi:hypothetical protein